MTKLKEALLEAHNKGYKVSKEGDLISPQGIKLKTTKNIKGYLKFNVRVNNEYQTVYLHRLQAYQKFGTMIFNKGVQVRHLDNIKQNNSKNNIAIGTQSDNRMDIPKEQRIKIARKGLTMATEKARKVNRRFNDDEVKKIRNFYNSCKSYKKTMEQFNIGSKGTLNYLLKNAQY